jgi:hypothetical protein
MDFSLGKAFCTSAKGPSFLKYRTITSYITDAPIGVGVDCAFANKTVPSAKIKTLKYFMLSLGNFVL